MEQLNMMEEEKKNPSLSEEEKERYRKILKEKLPELKQIEGFPLGKDEDILSLSDPPYYTACPNPFINEFIKKWEWEKHCSHHEAGMKDTEGNLITEESFDIKKCPFCIEIDSNYHREPYASDVSEGKNHPIYNAHSYHTKVPHKAIMRYILHYTEPGDIVFDGFCGTGMTGVAAQLCYKGRSAEGR
ncbi:MAG TPA: DNA methyltransferase [Candidatus Eremiobacteraeota bacterium]|nr:DNA methyltransferase [Candidatus Eremiobacteraeota bacterium]